MSEENTPNRSHMCSYNRCIEKIMHNIDKCNSALKHTTQDTISKEMMTGLKRLYILNKQLKIWMESALLCTEKKTDAIHYLHMIDWELKKFPKLIKQYQEEIEERVSVSSSNESYANISRSSVVEKIDKIHDSQTFNNSYDKLVDKETMATQCNTAVKTPQNIHNSYAEEQSTQIVYDRNVELKKSRLVNIHNLEMKQLLDRHRLQRQTLIDRENQVVREWIVNRKKKHLENTEIQNRQHLQEIHDLEKAQLLQKHEELERSVPGKRKNTFPSDPSSKRLKKCNSNFQEVCLDNVSKATIMDIAANIANAYTASTSQATFATRGSVEERKAKTVTVVEECLKVQMSDNENDNKKT